MCCNTLGLSNEFSIVLGRLINKQIIIPTYFTYNILSCNKRIFIILDVKKAFNCQLNGSIYYGNKIIQTFIIALHALYKIIIQHSDYNVNRLYTMVFILSIIILRFIGILQFIILYYVNWIKYRLLLYKNVNKQKNIYSFSVNVKM